MNLSSLVKNWSNVSIFQASNLAKLTEQFIWRTAIDMERENNIEERGDSKTLKVGESFLSHQIFTIERDDVNVWAMAQGNFNFIQDMTFKR